MCWLVASNRPRNAPDIPFAFPLNTTVNIRGQPEHVDTKNVLRGVAICSRALARRSPVHGICEHTLSSPPGPHRSMSRPFPSIPPAMSRFLLQHLCIALHPESPCAKETLQHSRMVACPVHSATPYMWLYKDITMQVTVVLELTDIVLSKV